MTSAGAISRNAVARFTALTGDPGYAASALLEELTLSSQEPVAYPELLSAERAVIAAEFGGDRTKYWAAVKAAKLTLADARAIIAARLERDEVEATFKAPAPSRATIADFLATYADEDVRLVSATDACALARRAREGLGDRDAGADGDLHARRRRGRSTPRTGRSTSRRRAAAMPLGLLPPAEAAAAARQALGRLTRETIYRNWLRGHERRCSRPPRA